MRLSDEQLKEALIASQLIAERDLNAAFAKAQTEQLPFGEVLLNEDLIPDEHLGRITAEQLSLPFLNLRTVQIPDDILRLIPEVVAKNRKVIAVKRAGEELVVAMADPDDLETVSLVQKAIQALVRPAYATERDIAGALARYRRGLQEDFAQLLQQAAADVQGRDADQAEVAVVRLVEQLLAYAYDNKASDIHLEPQRAGFVVRFRIDGVLHHVVELPKDLEPQIVSRLKVLSRLRTDEHAAAQDGKFRFTAPEEHVDVRVSILPVTSGEKVVLRLLSSKNREFSLEDLGLGPGDLNQVKLAFGKPFGMVLATGPTGCGKTTTLYAIVKILNSREVNISTIEDPVEYEIAGVNQIQVNAKTNLTFAAGLRSILRQDPDVIMVGEIRDEEASGIAINAAMTGHLVLSTLHTNDAATALPRLLDLNVEPFLIASTVNVIIGQRLVRQVCGQCRVSHAVPRQEIGRLFSPELFMRHFGRGKAPLRLYRGKGCPVCGQTGIFEVLQVSEAIRQLIMARVNADQIKAAAIKAGMTTMLDDGLAKAVKGITTVEEVLRATRE